MQSDHGRYRILGNGKGWLLHLSAEIPPGWVIPERNPIGIYLYDEDVDAIASDVADLAISVPEHKPWGMYEFALSDPDGTLVRIGWPSRGGA